MEKTLDENKGSSNKAIIALVVTIAVIVVLLVVGGRKSKFEPVLEGEIAPDFTLSDLNGKPVKLSDYKGKIVFLNFWATWCKPCEEEMPSMQELHIALKDKDFQILAVSIDSGDKNTVESFVKKYELTFQVLHDKNGKIKEIYKTTGVPETFIIDQKGVIAEKVIGPRDWSKQSNIGTITMLLTTGPSSPDRYKQKRVYR